MNLPLPSREGEMHELRALLIDCVTLWSVEARIAACADGVEIATDSGTFVVQRAPPDMRPVRWLLQTPDRRAANRPPRATPSIVALLTALRNALGAERGNKLRIGASHMKQDERGLALSTDSDAAVASFDRAVEHFLKFHADTMVLVDQALEADPGLRHGTLPQGLSAPDGGEPREPPADRCHTRRARRPVPRTSRSANGCTSPPPPPGTRRTRQVLPDLATDPRRRSHRPAGVPHLRHDLVPPRPDGVDPANRPTASRRAGRPICRATTAPRPSGRSRTRRSATPRARNARSMRRWNATRPTTSRITSRRTSWTPTAARARAATGSRVQVPNWSLGNNLIHHLWWHRTLMQLDLGERDAVLASYDAEHPQLRRSDDQGDARPLRRSAERRPRCCGGWNCSASMSATAGTNWPTRRRPASARPAIC